MAFEFKDGLEFAKQLDKLDKLHYAREKFYLNEGEIYMDGNSLGVSSMDAEKALLNMFEVWRKEAIKIWGVENGFYFNYSRNIAGESLTTYISFRSGSFLRRLIAMLSLFF